MIERLFTFPRLAGVRISALQWSPDGTRLAFLRAEPDTDAQDLWSWEASGSAAPRRLVRADDLLAGTQIFSREEELVRERTRQTSGGITRFLWSPDGEALFIPLNGNIYRFRLGDGSIRRLTRNREAEFDLQIDPTGRYLSYVRGGEIYRFDPESAAELRLTRDAGGTVKNGVSEFVAQEEMGRTTGVWWSPSGDRLAFLQVDTAPVGVFHIPNYLAPDSAADRQEYPKAGTANAAVRLGVISADGGDPLWISYKEREDDYLARVDWFPDDRRLAVQVQSRDQKSLRLLAIDTDSGTSRLLLEERDPCWVSLHGSLRFLPDGRRFLWSSERSGWQHLYLYDDEGRLLRRLTDGAWDVDRLVHLDSNGDRAFFIAAVAGPTERHLCSVSTGGGPLDRITTDPGWHDAAVSPDGTRAAVLSSRFAGPPVLRVIPTEGGAPAELEANPARPLAELRLPVPEFITVPARDGVPLNGLVLRPQGGARLPVIMYVYGGPTVQVVADQWGVMGGWQRTLWHRMMAARGYAVVCVDGRGTPGRGRAFQNAVHRALGRRELEDQADAAAWVRAQPWADPDRVMLWGKSYGGFMACMAAFLHPSLFRLCIAVAPVTDWHNYDTHYTERYMGLPEENSDGYRSCSPLHHAAGLGTRFLLVHGMADDNVHFQDAILLADALQRANRRFDFMPYPRSTHAFSGDDVGLHLYSTLAAYIEEHL